MQALLLVEDEEKRHWLMHPTLRASLRIKGYKRLYEESLRAHEKNFIRGCSYSGTRPGGCSTHQQSTDQEGANATCCGTRCL